MHPGDITKRPFGLSQVQQTGRHLMNNKNNISLEQLLRTQHSLGGILNTSSSAPGQSSETAEASMSLWRLHVPHAFLGLLLYPQTSIKWPKAWGSAA